MLRGGAWMVAMRWCVRGIGLVSTIVLARLLTPEDFGVVALAALVVSFLEVFTHAGMDVPLIRDQRPDRETTDSAWTLRILLCSGLGIVLLAVAPLAAQVFDEPRLTAVIQVLSIRAFVMGFENIGIVAFRRDLDFQKEFRFQVVKKLGSFVTALSLAVVLGNYWALVGGMLALQIVGVAMSFAMHPYRPRPCVRQLPYIWSFSQWIVLTQIGRFLNQKIDALVVGWLSGTAVMGNYHVASDLSVAPTTEIVLPMARGLFPVYAKRKDDPDRLARDYTSALSTVALICLPLTFGLAAVADTAVPVVLGSQWTDAIALIELLALFAGAYALFLSIEAILKAVGRTRLMATVTWIQVAALVPTILGAGFYGGAETIAAARMAVAAAAVPLGLGAVVMATRVDAPAVALAVLPRLAASGVMYLLVDRLLLLPDAAAAWQRLAVGIAFGAAVYAALTLAFWLAQGRPSGPERAVLDYLTRARAAWASR
jgi:O-antigen/teichoic acid export membrane protein